MLKMSALVEATGERKSTILYYVKEGLLPEPVKLKPNVHLYQDEVVNIIKLIKYFQINFSYTINQIKIIFNNNCFDFNNNVDVLIKLLDTISGGSDNLSIFSKLQVLEKFDISNELLDEFLRKEYLLPKGEFYNKKDLDILEMLLEARKNNIDETLFTQYVKSAKELAILEYKMGSALIRHKSENLNLQQKLMFDLILTFKPYIFNKQTIRQHTKKISGKEL